MLTALRKIYDFAGNCDEFTQEAFYTGGRALSGGAYYDNGSNYPDSLRGFTSPTNSLYGSRPTLYLIP